MRPMRAIGLTNPRAVSIHATHHASTHEALPPIRDGAWAAWASRGPIAGPSVGAESACRLPDGRLGVLVAVPDGDTWRLVCQVP
jgi:hypothetical protein